MRLFDLILAIVVLAVLLFIAREQFPSYAGKSYVSTASQASSPTPAPSPAPAASPAPAPTQ